MFGGEGFIPQRLVGDGMAFIHAGGHIVKKVLNNDSILVDTGCLVGYTSGVDFTIQNSGGVKAMAFGDEGLLLAKLSGTGVVLIQSSPISRLISNLSSNIQASLDGRSSDVMSDGSFVERGVADNRITVAQIVEQAWPDPS